VPVGTIQNFARWVAARPSQSTQGFAPRPKGTTLATAQVDTLRIKLLRNTLLQGEETVAFGDAG
jgi:hypothetical protein